LALYKHQFSYYQQQYVEYMRNDKRSSGYIGFRRPIAGRYFPGFAGKI